MVRMQGKENILVEEQENFKSRTSDHAAKVREVRDARRKRILARSSERLAYITASAGETKSPLLEKTNSPSLLSLEDAAPTADADMDMCKYFSDHETTVNFLDDDELRKPFEPQQELHNTIASTSFEMEAGENYTRMTEATMPQAAADTEACKRQAHTPVQDRRPRKFMSKLSFCMQYSSVQHARLIGAACTAMVFLVAGCVQGGRPDALLMIYFPLAVVFVMDMLLFTGAYVLLSRSEQMKNVEASGGTLPTIMQLLLTISLNCSISASLICGGFLISKYHGHIL